MLGLVDGEYRRTPILIVACGALLVALQGPVDLRHCGQRAEEYRNAGTDQKKPNQFVHLFPSVENRNRCRFNFVSAVEPEEVYFPTDKSALSLRETGRSLISLPHSKAVDSRLMKLAKIGTQRLKVLWLEFYRLHTTRSHFAVRCMQQRFELAL